MRGYDGSPITKAALCLAPLVFVRPGELRSAEWAGGAWRSFRRWLLARQREWVHCCACGGRVTPWTPCCPTCGQADPSRVPASVGIYLTLGFALLAAIFCALVYVF